MFFLVFAVPAQNRFTRRLAECRSRHQQFLDVVKHPASTQNYLRRRAQKQISIETTGCGVAFYDYDNDGWLDIFLVNGSRLEGFPKGQEQSAPLQKHRDGTFTDVTSLPASLTQLGQACCVGDYDNDGFDDLFVSYFGKIAFITTTATHVHRTRRKSWRRHKRQKRWNSGCALSTTIATANSTCSSPITLTWTSPRALPRVRPLL